MRLSVRGTWIAASVLLLVVATVTWAAADKVVYRSVEPLVLTQDVPCIGTLDITFVWRTHVIEGTDGSGGYHYNFHSNISKFRAVDADGNVYSGSETINQNYHVADGGFPEVFTYTWNLHAVGRGSAASLTLKSRYKVVINAPGEVVVERFLDTAECR